MKICYISDIHIDRGSCFILNDVGAKVLIMAGDIVEHRDLNLKSELSYDRVDEFFKCVSDQFEYVLWVFGNHEFYGGTLDWSYDYAQRYIDGNGFGNIKILNRKSITIDDVTFHGATLWTDFNRGSPLTRLRASIMSEYRNVRINVDKEFARALTPEDIEDEFSKDWSFIKTSLSETQTEKNVVITHHCPVLEGFFDEYTYFYKSDLANQIWMMDRIPNFWVYGHTHLRENFTVGDLKIITNPRGYLKRDPIAKTFKVESFTL